MSDVGYSSEYEVYLTRENGVQIVTNDLSLTILKEMRYHEVSPSDIATELSISKSTVQASIVKLLRMGIVSQSPRVNDARSVVYHVDATLILCSDTDVEWQLYARSASARRIMNSGRCTCREDLSLYGASLTESGLNIVQGLFNVGAALTFGKKNGEWWNNLLSSMQEQCASLGVSVDMSTRNGVNLTFVSNGDNISDIPLIVVPMLGALMSHSKEVLGYNLSHDVSLTVNNRGQSVNMRIDPFIGQDFDDDKFDSVHRTMEYYRVTEPFAIYSIGNVATLFTNSTMMGVLYHLSNGDCSVNDLEKLMGISKATIYAAIMKLIELGAVVLDRDSGSPKRYSLVAEPILYCTDPDVMDCSNLWGIAERFQNGELDYYSAVISFAMESIRCMGIHFDRMFIRSGRSTARAVLELYPKMEPERLLDVACRMVSIPDHAEVVSMIPLRIRVTLAKNTLWGSWPGDFVKGFILEGLKAQTGDDYRITIETVREGSNLAPLIE
jgi:DNA-binding MarR family transcriptional regulator